MSAAGRRRTADPGTVLSYTWDAADLNTADGSGLALRLVSVKGGGGPQERIRFVVEVLERGVRVVDLSADYRYRSLERWQEVYVSEARQVPRTDADLCAEAVYGLPAVNVALDVESLRECCGEKT